MTTAPTDWDPVAETESTPPASEHGIVSRLVTRHGSPPEDAKEPYPDDLEE